MSEASRCRGYALGALQNEESRVNSSATVGTEPGGIHRYSLDTNPHTYAVNPHT